MGTQWTSLAIAVVTFGWVGCTGPPRVVPDANEPSVDGAATPPPDGVARAEAILEAPTPVPGQLVGEALSGEALGGVPRVEAGLSGLLATLPRLTVAPGLAIESDWLEIKKERDTTAQHRALARSDLGHKRCEDVIDLRSYEGRGLPAFGWRDRVRNRTFATPAMAATLVRALATLKDAYPDATVSLGDIAQIGCGSLNHGTLVRHVEDRPGAPMATTLLNQARLVRGHPVVVEEAPASDFHHEIGRFPTAETPVRIEHRLLAWDREAPEDGLRLRIASRRYIPYDPDVVDAVAPGRSAAPSLARAGRVMTSGRPLYVSQVATWRSGDGLVREWVQHWGSARYRSQVVTFGTRKNRGRRLSGRGEVRLSGWQRKKPGSYPAEVVWIASPGESTLKPWQALYEAGHISHLSGRDADLSYVTYGNLGHFALDVPNIDAERTWFWIQCLREAAATLGATLDRVLVDRRVYRRLEAALTPEDLVSKFWMKRVMIVGGHGAHHHIRVADCDGACMTLAQSFMDSLPSVTQDALPLAGLVERERQRLAAAAAAANPEPTQDSTPTPSR